MADELASFLTRSVADCPYCGEPVRYTHPRGLDHAGRLSHLACLAVPAGECAICGVEISRKEPRVSEGDELAHPECDAAGRPVVPSPVGPVEITDPLTLVMLEIGLHRARTAAVRKIPVSVRLHPKYVVELTRLAAAMYRGSPLSLVLSVYVVADPDVPYGEVVVELA